MLFPVTITGTRKSTVWTEYGGLLVLQYVAHKKIYAEFGTVRLVSTVRTAAPLKRSLFKVTNVP
jgi:hypothetical protein